MTDKLKSLFIRTSATLYIAAILIPAYLLDNGRFFGLALEIAIVFAILEAISIYISSVFTPIRYSELLITIIVFFELIACIIGLHVNVGTKAFSLDFLVGILLVCVATDVIAYLVGTFIGQSIFKAQPFPKTSPSKSWEGLISGFVGGIITASLWANFKLKTSDVREIWGLILTVPFAILGDYVESRFKRIYGVKDSNDYIKNAPVLKYFEAMLGGRQGHGGYFDRTDSLVMSITANILLVFVFS